MLLLKPRENPSLILPSSWWWLTTLAFLGLHLYLSNLCPFLSQGILSMCLYVDAPLLRKDQAYWSRAHPTLVWPHLNLASIYFQIRSHSEVLGLRTSAYPFLLVGRTQLTHNKGQISICLCHSMETCLCSGLAHLWASLCLPQALWRTDTVFAVTYRQGNDVSHVLVRVPAISYVSWSK